MRCLALGGGKRGKGKKMEDEEPLVRSRVALEGDRG
jgi:hypothetical protein